MKYIHFIIILISIFGCSNVDEDSIRRFENQIGTYKIDLNKTDLGSYAKDSAFYSSLEISYFKDSTFRLNMDVPFITDSFGVWRVGTNQLYQWNEMQYENVKWTEKFYQCCDEDSTFSMSSVTPKKGYEPVLEIYFKKISGKFPNNLYDE